MDGLEAFELFDALSDRGNSVASNNEFARCFKMLKEAQELRRAGEDDDWLDSYELISFSVQPEVR